MSPMLRCRAHALPRTPRSAAPRAPRYGRAKQRAVVHATSNIRLPACILLRLPLSRVAFVGERAATPPPRRSRHARRH